MWLVMAAPAGAFSFHEVRCQDAHTARSARLTLPIAASLFSYRVCTSFDRTVAGIIMRWTLTNRATSIQCRCSQRFLPHRVRSGLIQLRCLERTTSRGIRYQVLDRPMVLGICPV